MNENTNKAFDYAFELCNPTDLPVKHEMIEALKANHDVMNTVLNLHDEINHLKKEIEEVNSSKCTLPESKIKEVIDYNNGMILKYRSAKANINKLSDMLTLNYENKEAIKGINKITWDFNEGTL